MDKVVVDQLSNFVGSHVCVMGIGDRHWHDNGIGSYIAEALEGRPDIDVIDAGFIPENHLEEIAGLHPDSILMVDATDFGGEPGQTRLIYPEKVSYSGVSMHAGSLRMLAEYIHHRTHAPVALLAIQPEDTSAGESLSPAVADTFRDLLENLPRVCSKKVAKAR